MFQGLTTGAEVGLGELGRGWGDALEACGRDWDSEVRNTVPMQTAEGFIS